MQTSKCYYLKWPQIYWRANCLRIRKIHHNTNLMHVTSHHFKLEQRTDLEHITWKKMNYVLIKINFVGKVVLFLTYIIEISFNEYNNIEIYTLNWLKNSVRNTSLNLTAFFSESSLGWKHLKCFSPIMILFWHVCDICFPRNIVEPIKIINLHLCMIPYSKSLISLYR